MSLETWPAVGCDEEDEAGCVEDVHELDTKLCRDNKQKGVKESGFDYVTQEVVAKCSWIAHYNSGTSIN